MSVLKELKSQHRNIVQMSFAGYKNNEIAERLGMAPTTVSIILNTPLAKAYMGGLQDKAQEATLDVRKKLISLNKGALDTFARLLDPKEKAPHSVQFNAAKDVLDRNGYKAPDRLNIDMTLQTKTDAEIDAEIAAIEASINRLAPANVNQSLPEIEDHSEDSLPIIELSQSDFSQTPAIDDPDHDPEVDDTTEVCTASSSDQLSLEDLIEKYPHLYDELDPEELSSIAKNLPPDLFQSSNRG